MKISVVVPSYRRPDALEHCIPALLAQQRRPDEIIVVVREDDEDSRRLLKRFSEVTEITVDRPGAVHAMAQGSLASRGDVIAFTDDDACPSTSWLAQIEACFESSGAIGAVGGRDIIHEPDGSLRIETLQPEVGILRPSGKLIGNHHRGIGPARFVDVLKGVNSSYRREALALPDGLRGAGTQIHFEVAMGIMVKRAGLRLVYDPSITVDHHPAPRQDLDARGAPPAASVAGHAYNLTTSVGLTGRWRMLRRYAYAVIIGDRAMPGLLRALLLLAERDRAAMTRLRGSLSGNSAAVRDRLRGFSPTFVRPQRLP
jgi:hypothetical protein